MARAEDYAAWIIANPDKRGTPEFDTVARAYQQSRGPSALQSSPILGVPSSGQPQAAQSEQLDPLVAEMSTPQRYAAGAGKMLTDIGLGVRQYLPESMGGKTAADVAEKRALDAPLMASQEGRRGAVLGGVATALPLAVLPGANTVLGAGAYGALYGAAQPAETSGERIGNIAASGLGSAAITGGVRALPALKRALIDPFTQAGQEGIAARTLQRFASDPAALDQAGAPSAIPGLNMNLAEATRDPGIAQLLRSAQSASPEVASAMHAQQQGGKDAIMDALRRISGSEQDRKLTEGVRSMMSDPLYGQARAQGIDPQRAKMLAPQIGNLLERLPQGVLDEAESLAKLRGESITGAGSINGLHYVKLALDDMLKTPPAMGGLDGTRRAAVTQLRDDFLKTVDELSPDYAQARAAYASWSKPVTQQRVAAALAQKLEPAMGDLGQTSRLTPNAFAQALRDTSAITKRAGGMGKPIEDVMTPGNMNIIDNIGDYLSRRQFAQEAARVPGSPTAQYLAGQNLMQSVMGPLGLPRSWSDALLTQTLGNRWVSAAAKPVESQIQSKLAAMLLDPNNAQLALARLNQPGITGQVGEVLGRRALPPTAAALANLIYAPQQ